jgi:DNA-binding transcriptional LysR family regulator
MELRDDVPRVARTMTDLSLDQLRVLVTVVDTGSLSAAARKLRRAQSTVSYAIASLEERLGVILFDRSGYRPTLTPQGNAIVGEARAVLSGVDRLSSVASRMDTRRVEAKLRVAIDNLLVNDELAQTLAPFAQRFTATQLVLRSESARSAMQLLLSGDVDLAIHVRLPEAPSVLSQEPIGSIALVHVVAPKHPLAAHPGVISASVLRQHVQLVLSDRDPDAFKERDQGVAGGPTWRFMDMQLRLAALRAGAGYGSMPAWTAQPELRAGRLVRVALSVPLPEPLTVVASRQATRALGPAARWLVESVSAAIPPVRHEKSPKRAKRTER